ncbi:thiamine phosphate synthase [Desulforamulus aquiferis]|uniref:Thiamine-phosphate synthase n=1 Tax=Desulforamulus aquiferis TaxID=1397668 RepID=A0AAW7ZFN6_9FIRM|nr:thiamine phosphate synthase [Desulforamulus aquiferis]MDO7788092.1 thiamine phosphate synthase [Desulforamulus aquiferis]
MTVKRDLAQLLQADIYGITAEELSLGRSNVEIVKQMIAAGITVIQYREKDKKAREKYHECMKIRELTAQAGVTFIVNDDIDLAMIVGADGVHVGQEDLPPEKVRELVGSEMLIGLSTHSPEQAMEAQKSKAVDYIGVGPIYPTGTKKDVCAPVGLEYLEYVANKIDLPFVAIGGIKEHNIGEVARKGARCMALVSEIVGNSDIQAKVAALRKAMKES